MTDETFEYTTRVIPRDLEPGDRLQRRTFDPFGGQMATVTVARVEKVKNVRGAAYRIHLVEWEALAGWEKTLEANRHLKPFTAYPTQKTEVTRIANAKGLL
jgi:hypothetical protein